MKDIIELLKSEIKYFKKLKNAIGELHGHIHSLAVKTAHLYLKEKHPAVSSWEVSEKYGGGIDILGRNELGNEQVVAEVKTTSRSEKEQLGSQQKKKIVEDIIKLSDSSASNKYFFIIDNKNKTAIENLIKGHAQKKIQLVNIFEL